MTKVNCFVLRGVSPADILVPVPFRFVSVCTLAAKIQWDSTRRGQHDIYGYTGISGKHWRK